jgi:hypothetical protein
VFWSRRTDLVREGGEAEKGAEEGPNLELPSGVVRQVPLRQMYQLKE